MRILYGVVGEGMGHAIRSRVVLEWLTARHEVWVVASSRAFQYLKERFPNVHEIHGYTLAYDDNAVNKLKTVLANLKGAVKGVPQNVAQYFEISERFTPDCVISDFESFAYLYGRAWMRPVISIDNMQLINRCSHRKELIAGCEGEFQLTKAIVKSKAPGCLHYLVTTFFYPEVRKARTTLVPPILRPEILTARPEKGAHLLVYQTSTSNQELPELLKESGVPCILYGLRRDLKEDSCDGNLRYRPFSEEGFIDDLRTSRAVLASGGFTLMGEAVHLHKPMLCVPLKGQFEQVLNARYLEHEGFGLCAPEVTQEALARFIQELPRYEERLATYRQDGNQVLFGHLARLLDQVEQGRGAPFEVIDDPSTIT